MPTSKARILGDAELTKSVALPNAANTAVTASINLGPQPYNATEGLNFNLRTTAGNGANNSTITAVLQHSNEAAANFTNIPELATLVLTDANNAGYPATARVVKLPPSTRQYVRVSATGVTGGGNAANGTITLSATR
jgi:hypothetical protein